MMNLVFNSIKLTMKYLYLSILNEKHAEVKYKKVGNFDTKQFIYNKKLKINDIYFLRVLLEMILV